MIISDKVKYKNKLLSYDELKNSSKILLEVECDSCHKRFKSTKYQIVRNCHQLCQSCAIKQKESKPLRVGTRYGFYIVLGSSNKRGYSICQCECGNVREVDNYTLTSGLAKSCGCKKLNVRYKSIEIGEKFGRLTIIDYGHNGGYSICECDCGNVIEISNSKLRLGSKLSCGCLQKETASKWLKQLDEKQNGINHPNWQGGISKLRSRDMATNKYKDFRKAVFERDNYTCQKCKKGSNKLNAHHIYDYKNNKDLRYSVNNGITLCQKCHIEFHKIYGKTNNKEQLKEFLKG